MGIDAARVSSGPGAMSMEAALTLAYVNNPQLNAQRAATRAIDENVPTALSGYRPRVTGTASLTEQYLDTLTKNPTTPPAAASYNQTKGAVAVSSAGIAATQTLLNGFQTANRTRQAEAQVLAARETLRTTEQTVLLAAATAFMNLLQTAAILELQQSNVNVLEVTLRQTRDRFAAGEVTRTDVAQAESRLASGRSQLSLAESNYITARAQFRQVIGVDPPARLSPATPVDRFAPRTLAGAIERGRSEHPTITTAMYNVDVAAFQVKVAEGALAPTLSAVGAVTKSYGSANSLAVVENLSASIGAQYSVPIYQGGSEYAAIRQAKETLGQRRLDLDTARDQVQQTVTQAWGQVDAAKAQINATQAQVTAAEVALNGVREEARVGQRTTLDVLNAQQDLVNARAALVTAQRDRVVFSYTVLAAVGSLSPQVLGLKVPTYDPMVHYQQVRDAWGGVRIPDGR
ncbi:MAG: TolC family outer membrane protein [Hyphomicrobiales bacterium]|nr:TolC family outer membrane protein [Hyphomicrobiales bacterium]